MVTFSFEHQNLCKDYPKLVYSTRNLNLHLYILPRDRSDQRFFSIYFYVSWAAGVKILYH
jgi:hypothetical protein